jgi:replicative DNA helicase
MFITPKDEINKTVENIEKINNGDIDMIGIPTGYADLDYIVGGLKKSNLIVIAGRPSMGKTALAVNMALNISVKNSIPSAIFSLEMSSQELLLRMIMSHGGISYQNIRDGNLTDKDWSEIMETSSDIAKAPIYIDDNPSVNIINIQENCQKLKEEHGDIGAIFIDYLQLVSDVGKRSREEEVAGMSRQLKIIAKQLDVPVVALSQLNRECESRREPKPKMSDLRESGSIEQDSDVILLMYRPGEYFDNVSKSETHVNVAKQRNGRTGWCELSYDGDSTKFKDKGGLYA